MVNYTENQLIVNIMKKFLYLSAAAAVSLFAASCSSDDMPEINPDGMTTFQVQLPEHLASRAFGDGFSATNLYVAIYDADNSNLLFSNFPGAGAANGMTVSKFSDHLATVNVNLVKNKEYNIVFWAQQPEMTASGGAFTYSATDRTIKVDYTKLTCNTENADAFYSYETYISAPTSNKTFKLYRPFAQVNIGTDDLAAAKLAGLDVTQAGMTLTGVADLLDVTTGTASGNVDAQYTAQNRPTATDGSFPANTDAKKYDYLTMGYVLVPAAKTAKGTTNVSLVIPDGPKAPFATYDNVPIQANYRTNIFGSLLTNPEVFNVVIEPAFAGDAKWEGTADDLPQEVEGVYTVTEPKQLAAIAVVVNSGENNFAGKTITLANDIDLSNLQWTPVGTASNKTFAGTFDGQGHTVSNFNAVGDQYAGLFGAVSGTVKNVNVSNATVSSNHYAGGVVGWLQNANTNDSRALVENCNVINSTVGSNPKQADGAWDNGDKVGAIVGYGYSFNMTNCHANNVTVSGYRNLGGLIGYANTVNDKNPVIADCSVNNATIIQDMAHNYKGIKPGELIGAIDGACLAVKPTLTRTTAASTSYVFKNWTAKDYFSWDASVNDNVTVDNFDCNTVRLVAYGHNKVNVKNSHFTKAAEGQGNNDYNNCIDIYFKNNAPIDVNIEGNEFESSWAYSILCQTDNSTPTVNVNIANNSFDNWCLKDINNANVKFACTAIKIYNIANYCYTEESRTAFVTGVLTQNNNTFSADMQANGWPLIQTMTGQAGGRYIYSLNNGQITVNNR